MKIDDERRDFGDFLYCYLCFHVLIDVIYVFAGYMDSEPLWVRVAAVALGLLLCAIGASIGFRPWGWIWRPA